MEELLQTVCLTVLSVPVGVAEEVCFHVIRHKQLDDDYDIWALSPW